MCWLCGLYWGECKYSVVFLKTVKQTFQNDKKHNKGSFQLPNVYFIFLPGINVLAYFQCMLPVISFNHKNFKFIFACNISKAEVRSAWNPSVSGIVLTKCFTCISVVFDLFCIKLFVFKHWQEFKYKMLAVTFHLADYVRCLSFERWWHCHQKNNILTSSKKILEVIILQPYHLVKDQKNPTMHTK